MGYKVFFQKTSPIHRFRGSRPDRLGPRLYHKPHLYRCVTDALQMFPMLPRYRFGKQGNMGNTGNTFRYEAGRALCPWPHGYHLPTQTGQSAALRDRGEA